MENESFPLTSSVGLLYQSWAGMTEDRETPILDTVVLHACFCSSLQFRKPKRVALEGLKWWLQTSLFPFPHLHGSLCNSSISPLFPSVLVGKISWPCPEDPRVWERKRTIWRTPRLSTWGTPCEEALERLRLILLRPPVEQQVVLRRVHQLDLGFGSHSAGLAGPQGAAGD